ncbi:MAG: hypothetical protein ACTSYH_03585 [Candidatus Heimdallarchaeaceae archaeon]
MTYIPSLVNSTVENVGTWRIDSWRSNTPRAVLGLKDLKSAVKTKLPLNVFSFDDYTNADPDIIGEPIPIIFGAVKGAKAFLIDSTTGTFKVAGHSLLSFTSYYDSNRESFSPDSVDLDNGEFVYADYDENTSYYADVVAVYDNPIDVIETLLTDTTRGVGLSSSLLGSGFDESSDSGSAGQGGVRSYYIRGINTNTLAEVSEFPIALYLDTSKSVFDWIQEVLVASFAIMYIDRSGLYQIRAWKPSVGENVLEITKNNIPVDKQVEVQIDTGDPVTKAIVEYDKVHGLNSVQIESHSDDELRQLRGLTAHAVLQKFVPLSDSISALYWAQRTVAMRGVPRITYSLTVTQEFSELEPGDTVRLNYSPLNINEICEVLEVTIYPGTMMVDLRLSDVRGFKDGSGYWVEDSPSFPNNLGGGTITDYDDANTDAKRQWIRENIGIWTEDTGYADENVPLLSYRLSRWV